MSKSAGVADRPGFEVTVPKCKKITGGTVAPRLVASDRGWVCPTHGGLGCADRQSHSNLKKSREAAKLDPLAVRVLTAVKRNPSATVSQIRRKVDPKAAPGTSRVPRVIRYLRDAGLMPADATPKRSERVTPDPDYTVLDVECSHPETVDSYRGMHVIGRRCVECSTLLPV